MTGFFNIEHGVEDFIKHIFSNDSIMGATVSAVATELVDYEKAHDKGQLAAIKTYGLNAYTTAKAAGKTTGEAILAGVAAAFESAVADVKTLSTQAMTFLISAAAK